MSLQNRTKKSTLSNQLATHRDLAKPLPSPTEDLCPEEMQYFSRVIESRELSTWSTFDLTIATSLAKLQWQLSLAVNQLKEEGLTVLDAKGQAKAHPCVGICTGLGGTIKSFVIQLGLSADAKGLASQEQAGRNNAERRAREAINQASGGLLA